MEKETVFTSKVPEPIGPYSQGVLAGGFLFSSGQIGIDADSGELVSPDVAAQARTVLKNIGEVLKAKGLTFRDVVKTTVYIVSMADFHKVNQVYEEFFPAQPPARTTVEVSSLPKGAKVEIDAIACRQA